MHHHKGFVAFHIGGDRARAHVGAVAQNAVPHVVVVRRLHIVKEDYVFQLHRVANHAVFPHQRRPTHKRAVPHLRARADDARRAQIGRGGYRGRAVHPYLRRYLGVLLRVQLRSQLKNHRPDAPKRLPGIGKSPEVLRRQGMGQVVKLFDGIHVSFRLLTKPLRSAFPVERLFFQCPACGPGAPPVYAFFRRASMGNACFQLTCRPSRTT